MRYPLSFGRIALRICAALVVFVFVAGIIARGQRYLLRHRAEMLLADMQTISLRQTTLRDVQPMMIRWRRWGSYDGPCDEVHCSFNIQLSDLNIPLSQFLYGHRAAFALANLFGEPPTAIRAHFTVIDGIVWSESIGFGIETQGRGSEDRRYVELLGGSARSISKTDPLFWGPNWHLHPDYNISWTGKMRDQMQLELTPFANPADIHRLMVLNLSCLTRLIPCRDKNDFMPVAVVQLAYWRSLPDESTNIEDQCDDPMTVERFGRDSRNIAIAQVTTGRVIPEESDVNSRIYDLTLTLQQELKARAQWNSQKPLKLSMSYPMSIALPQPGSSVLVFFNDDSFGPYSTDGCSPLPATAPNLSAVRRGIAEDNRPSDLPD